MHLHLSPLSWASAALAVLITPAAGAALVPRWGHAVVHERRSTHPGWEDARRLPADVPVPLRIALAQQNLHTLPGHLLAVADPESPTYGAHWSAADVAAAFAPVDEARVAVAEWLVHAGFAAERVKVSYNKAWIEVAGATAQEVEALLETEYRIFKREDGEEHVACHNYSIPAYIAPHIDFVLPTVQPNTRLVKVQNRDGFARRQLSPAPNVNPTTIGLNGSLVGCDTLVVPGCLKTLYNVTYTPNATDRNTFGIASFYSNTYLQSDLDAFFADFSPALVGTSPILVSIDGGTIALDPSSSVGEDDWIFEYAMTLSAPQPVQFLNVGSQQTGQFFSLNEWLDAVDGSYCTSDGGDDFTFDPQLPNPLPGGFKDHSCGTAKAPNVVSNSQAVDEHAYTAFYRQRQCNEFAKLGLMGVTVLYSAGNTGTSGTNTGLSGTQSGYCIDENGSVNLNATNFNPAWPASCPWITAVGGTQVKANATIGHAPEEVWNQDLTMGFFESGGGGFSNHFPTPDYQKTAVDAYLKFLAKNDPTTLRNFNTKGRAYPDISANANSFFHTENGSAAIDSGTSGATPTVASIITLVNDARISAGKKPVGFINPTIYSIGFAGAFNDITDGSNTGCKGLQGVRDGGFKATSGWDPASGVGTPNLGKLIEKWLALP
ncbi:hypothetical protein HYPSUDRAFT_201701 [Hypholoma sublateritium FD-334 SS-4]|uniref:tripeptidyl-peptidase II n=1 Tax=Hypholoma sublateritium (strain FD-334 SS-4) TaxID=945553 RepID=A0A0D2PU60_HYPSF|nr:hypothetical protein HYPSUDRAFT_201701 [Hypholoma sublateritium FD-334 SS-4]